LGTFFSEPLLVLALIHPYSYFFSFQPLPSPGKEISGKIESLATQKHTPDYFCTQMFYKWYTASKILQFGDPLPQDPDLPPLLRNCMEYFESSLEARRTHGIFRLSGSMRLIKELRAQSNAGQAIDLSKLEPVTVCCLMKDYLRSLPDPPIPRDFYSRFLDISRLEEGEWLPKAKELFAQIPPNHRNLCQRLFALIYSIGEEKEFNEMGHSNLAKVLFPILLSELSEMTIEKTIMELPLLEKTAYRCIVNHGQLF
jgi:RhoGAP domain